MSTPAVFPYVTIPAPPGPPGWMPMLPVTLRSNGATVTELGLVDSGAAVSVLPYQLGLHLGGDWNQTPGTIPLAGSLGRHPAKPLVVEGVIGSFPPIRLAFAWTQAPGARLLLGQVNFFMEFDVCFFRSRGVFQIQPRTP